MTRFQVITEKHGQHLVYVLHDMHTGAVARILPSLGANCMQLALVSDADEPPVPVINDLEFIDRLPEQPSRYGIPILFPWPSGLPGGEFAFQGKTWSMNTDGEKKSRHHGFVNVHPWKVVRSDCDNSAAWLTCAIDSVNCGKMAEQYPSQFRLEMTWRLSMTGFTMQMQAVNTGSRSMPLGMGLHPYFTIPFGSSGNRQTCRLSSDTGEMWDLDVIMDVAPGDTAPERLFLPRPAFVMDAPGGTPLGDTAFNHVYEANTDARQRSHASVIDSLNHYRLTVSGSKDFKTWVFYSPPNRSAISLEPWTLVPNGFNLAAAGVAESGIQIIEPGKIWSGDVQFSIERIS